jgi:exodeoxyribonuclease VIII
MDKEFKYYKDIPNNKYHADKEFISSSNLKWALESHANFRWMMEHNKSETQWKFNDPKDFGSLCHTLALEPEKLEEDFAIMETEGRNWRTKEDRGYKNSFAAYHQEQGKIVVTDVMLVKARECVKSIDSHPFFKKLIDAPGEVEMSGYFQDDFYGIRQRFRPDKVVTLDGKKILFDLKTTNDIEDFFTKAKFKFHYDLSAAMYLKGHNTISEDKIDEFYFGVLESEAPFRVAVYKASESFMAMGLDKYNRALANVKLAWQQDLPEVIPYQTVDFQEI